MFKHLKKRFIIPVLASGMLFIGASFKDDFFEIAKQIEIFTTLFKAVNSNYNVVIWPQTLQEKDINDMILADKDPAKIISKNIYNGLEAKMKFTAWKRC